MVMAGKFGNGRDKGGSRIVEPVVEAGHEYVLHRVNIAVAHRAFERGEQMFAGEIPIALKKMELRLRRGLATGAEFKNRIFDDRLLQASFSKRLLVMHKFEMGHLLRWCELKKPKVKISC